MVLYVVPPETMPFEGMVGEHITGVQVGSEPVQETDEPPHVQLCDPAVPLYPVLQVYGRVDPNVVPLPPRVEFVGAAGGAPQLMGVQSSCAAVQVPFAWQVMVRIRSIAAPEYPLLQL